jgi:hypothetical protein
MQRHLRSSEIPEPESVQNVRTMLIDLLKKADSGEITHLSVIGSSTGGTPLLATSGSENVFELLGFAMCHFIDRAMDVYWDQVYGPLEQEDEEEEEDNE